MLALRELYQEVILDHGKSPRNFGKPEHAGRLAAGTVNVEDDRFDRSIGRGFPNLRTDPLIGDNAGRGADIGATIGKRANDRD